MAPMFKLVDGYVVRLRPFPKLTRKTALAFSIKKWEFMVRHLKNGKRVNYDGSAWTCSLCTLYLNKVSIGCEGCPVREKTGRNFCYGTPFTRWCKSSSLATAEAELAFLRGLNP